MKKDYPGIVDMYVREGKTLKEIGEYFGFSRQRAQQILSRRYGIDISKAKWLKDAEKERADRRALKVRKRAIRRGVTDEEYAKIRAEFPGARDAYRLKRSNCAKVGIPFRLTFGEWWAAWGGRFGESGRHADALAMARIDITKPYEPGNVIICRFGDAVLQRSKQGEK